MTTDERLASLEAEVLALTTALGYVLENICNVSPAMRTAIAEGFDEAASDLEVIAMQGRESADAGQAVKAPGFVEGLRAAALGNL